MRASEQPTDDVARGRPRRARLLTALMAATLALAAVAGACGRAEDEASAGDGNGSGSRGRSKPDAHQAFLDYARCMREQGVDMPDPDGRTGVVLQVGDPSVDAQKLADAERQCGKHLAGVTVDNPGGLSNSEMQDRMVRFARCMRGRGFDIPDPQPVGSGAAPLGQEPDLDFNDPKFKQAQRECSKSSGLPEAEEPRMEGVRR